MRLYGYEKPSMESLKMQRRGNAPQARPAASGAKLAAAAAKPDARLPPSSANAVQNRYSQDQQAAAKGKVGGAGYQPLVVKNRASVGSAARAETP